MRIGVSCAVLLASGCVGGSVEASGEVAMDVADAVYWVQSGTGEPNVDGAVIVLLSDQPDACAAIESGRFEGPWSFFGLEAYPPTSSEIVGVGDYAIGAAGRHAEAHRLQYDGGCRAMTSVAQASEGTLSFTESHDGEAHNDVGGRFEGVMGDQSAVVEFHATWCQAGAELFTPHVRSLRFKTCQ
jgi:hypothetical protein